MRADGESRIREAMPFTQREDRCNAVARRRSVTTRMQKGSQRYPFDVAVGFPDTANFIGIVGNLGSRDLLNRVIGELPQQRKHSIGRRRSKQEMIPGVGWSDHWSFWRAGVFRRLCSPTLRCIDIQHYHEPSDTPDKLDYDRMARVVHGLVTVRIRSVSETRVDCRESPCGACC